MTRPCFKYFLAHATTWNYEMYKYQPLHFQRQLPNLGRFPFVRTDRPGHSLRNENFTFNQSYPARSVNCYILCTKEIVFHHKLKEKAYFIFKMTGAAIVWPASSDFWKAPLELKKFRVLNYKRKTSTMQFYMCSLWRCSI